MATRRIINYSPYLGDAASAAADELTAAFRNWHSQLAAINELQAQYEASPDPRFLQSLAAMRPYVEKAGARWMAAVRAADAADDAPGQVAMVLADLSDWLTQRVQNVTNAAEGTLNAAPTLVKSLPWVLIAGAVVVGIYLWKKK